jgi:hypothetical protein
MSLEVPHRNSPPSAHSGSVAQARNRRKFSAGVGQIASVHQPVMLANVGMKSMIENMAYEVLFGLM